MMYWDLTRFKLDSLGVVLSIAVIFNGYKLSDACQTNFLTQTWLWCMRVEGEE